MKREITIPESEQLLTVREVAILLRVDGTTVRRWIKQNVLQAVILPHMHKREAYRVRRSIINALLEKKVA